MPGPPPAIQSAVDEAIARVEAYFGRDFPKAFSVEVLPDRAALDEHWRSRWAPAGFESECWMVASGEHDELALLSLDAWRRDACEHDPDDATHVQQLVAHEVVHVFHDQIHPAPSFDELDPTLAWLVEGLAVHVSGQLETEHSTRAREAISTGQAPTRLADAWSGPFRYGVSGSLVSFVDRCFGRPAVIELLSVSSQDEALAVLGMDEGTMLRTWQDWARAETPGPCPSDDP